MARRPLLEFNPETIWGSCYPPPWTLIIIGTSIAVFLVSSFIGLIVYRRRWAIKLWCYHKRYGKRGRYRRLDSEDFDVVISSDPADREWVLYKFRKRFDARENGHFRTFCEEVDVHLGQMGIGPMSDAMMTARIILLVLSPDYFSNARCEFEASLAQQTRAETNRPLASIQMVLHCTEQEAVQYLPRCLHANIDEELVWSEDEARRDVFWNKLEQVIHTEENA